jgi:hypothetical protein
MLKTQDFTFETVENQSNVIVIRPTPNQLGPEFTSRRLCRMRVASITEPVGIFELARKGDVRLATVAEPYEAALKELEQGHYPQAARKLGEVLAKEPNDGPVLMLVARTVCCLTESPARVESAWEVPAK